MTPIITERNGRKTLTTVQGLPKKFDQKKILKVIKKKFGKSPNPMSLEELLLTRAHLACNGTIVNDTEMGEVIQLQGDQRKDVQEFLVDKKEGLELDAKTIKVLFPICSVTLLARLTCRSGPRILDPINNAPDGIPHRWTDRSSFSKHKSLTSYLLCWCGMCQAKACVGALVDTL